MNTPPRLVIAALRGGAGKTTLSLGLISAWGKRGIPVAPFKKGPDYIDAAWLSLAAGRPCHNLDLYLMGDEEVRNSFWRHAPPGGISLIEGNRGLYDGLDSSGSQSTAELAKLLQAPVVLILECDKVTRTAAAMVLGCQRLDPKVDIQGVILNRVSGSRHERILRLSIEDSCHVPVLGAIPRMNDFPFPERHLGLIPPQEHPWVKQALNRAGEMAEKYLDLDGLERIAQRGGPGTFAGGKSRTLTSQSDRAWAGDDPRPVIGVIRDSAFQFYYPENLQALADSGARVVEVSAVQERELPAVDGLYIGGGFPETHARLLADNTGFRASLRLNAEKGLPIYAECGGLMYLGESLEIGGEAFPMVGALPLSLTMEKRPQGHGYTLLEVEKENPFFPVGMILKGHEFHYSRVLVLREEGTHFAFAIRRGTGVDGKRDGLCRHNILASYTHLHALGCPQWAPALVGRARSYRLGQMPAAVAL